MFIRYPCINKGKELRMIFMVLRLFIMIYDTKEINIQGCAVGTYSGSNTAVAKREGGLFFSGGRRVPDSLLLPSVASSSREKERGGWRDSRWLKSGANHG